MGGRFANSMALARSSWNVLRDDKQLALLPAISLATTALVAVGVLVPIGLIVHNGSGGSAGGPVVWILGFAGALALTYVAVFFNAALVFAADRRFRGENVTIREAIDAAGTRAHVLLPWALLSVTVSLVLRAVEQRGGIVGAIVGRIADMAWSVVTFLVLPVLVFEGTGPIDAVKRSGQLFKRTWGENLITNGGIGLVGGLLALAGIVPLMLFFAIGGPAVVVGIALFVAWILAISVVSAALTGIFQVALYRFATGAPVPGFDQAQLRQSFRTRRSMRNPGGFFSS
jgi:hypothetical protein